MTYIVTGAAGFIGSNIVKGLNDRGIHDIIAVDDLSDGNKFAHLAALKISHYMDKHDFMHAMLNHQLHHLNVTAVFHQGACSDTMNHDGAYMMRNNYQYTYDLFLWCQDLGIPLLYASSAAVYGGSATFVEDLRYELPLNVYGYSKFLFDQVLRRHLAEKNGLKAPTVGFRYFNVYGNNEDHKGRMASVPYHQFQQFMDAGHVTLFGAYGDYAAGCQRRDFIHVDDVVKVNLFFLDQIMAGHQTLSGIYNLGTGQSHSFNELSSALVNRLRQLNHQTSLSLEELVAQGLIRYRDFPDALKGKYQSFTEANIDALRAVGYQDAFMDVASGVARYAEYLYTENQNR